MKKTLILMAFSMTVFWLGHSFIYAESQATNVEARHVIGRTAAVIMAARRSAAQGDRYEGLGLALAHQVLARELYRHGNYPEAIFHSLRARILAARVIQLNKNDLLNEALYDRMEAKYAQSMPPDQELDQQLKQAKVAVMSDPEAAGAGMDLDVD
ncbi:MAG: hypothetical protein ACM3X9_06870 [Bacillota bacterium]